jgi:putative phosphoesterase
MKLGLIADIHGNIAALDAVLQDMPQVDALICAGDVVGYYPHANEACHRLRELGAHVVRGNHDIYVAALPDPDVVRLGSYRIEWTRAQLTPENLQWLSELPPELRFEWNGQRVRVRHASPWDEETYLYPDSPELDGLELEGSEILVLGHTHHPLVRQCGDALLINPGSVGQPRDRNPRPSYAILEVETREVCHRRATYDVERFEEELRQLNWEAGTIGILSRTQ